MTATLEIGAHLDAFLAVHAARGLAGRCSQPRLRTQLVQLHRLAGIGERVSARHDEHQRIPQQPVEPERSGLGTGKPARPVVDHGHVHVARPDPAQRLSSRGLAQHEREPGMSANALGERWREGHRGSGKAATATGPDGSFPARSASARSTRARMRPACTARRRPASVSDPL